MEERTVRWEGQTIRYVLERKQVKNINLRIRPEGVFASASRRVSALTVDRFVLSRAPYILQVQERFAAMAQAAPPPRRYEPGEVFHIQGEPFVLEIVPGRRDGVSAAGGRLALTMAEPADTARRERLVIRYMEGRCRTLFGQLLERLYPLVEPLGAARPTLRFRDMRSRWGVCNVQKAVITINKRLLPMDPAYGEYVLMHELCHLLVADHSPRFYALLGSFMPDWRARRAALNASPSHWP